MKQRYVFSLIALLVILIVAVLLIINSSQQPAKSHQQTHVVTVTTTTLKKTKLPIIITTYGATYAPNSIIIKAPNSGTITKIAFVPGERVKAGQLLFRLRVAEVDNQLTSLKARMETSKSLYLRQRKMARAFSGSISKYTLLQSKLQYQQDAAAYQEALNLHTITAPVAGYISDTTLRVGSFVTPSTTLATINNNHDLEVQYSVTAQYASQLKLGQAISFHPNNSKSTYTGKVSYISAALNPQTYNYTVKATLNKPGALVANRYGSIKQTLLPATQLALSQNWVQTDAKGYFIFSVKQKKIIKRHFIPGQVTANGLITIKSGLKKGTLIVTSPIQALTPGQTVTMANVT